MRSSRRREAESHHNIEVIWLRRAVKLDFKTVADFARMAAAPSKPWSASSPFLANVSQTLCFHTVCKGFYTAADAAKCLGASLQRASKLPMISERNTHGLFGSDL